jgi:hypothetical protein
VIQESDNYTMHLPHYIYTVKPVLRGHLLDKENGLIRQVTS